MAMLKKKQDRVYGGQDNFIHRGRTKERGYTKIRIRKKKKERRKEQKRGKKTIVQGQIVFAL